MRNSDDLVDLRTAQNFRAEVHTRLLASRLRWLLVLVAPAAFLVADPSLGALLAFETSEVANFCEHVFETGAFCVAKGAHALQIAFWAVSFVVGLVVQVAMARLFLTAFWQRRAGAEAWRITGVVSEERG